MPHPQIKVDQRIKMNIENSNLKCIVDEFLSSKRNSNCLLELEKMLLSPNDDSILSSIEAVLYLFTNIFQKNFFTDSLKDNTTEDYKLWLFNRYEDFISHLVWYLSYTNSELQHAALRALMLLLQLQSQHLERNLQKNNQAFPCSVFMKIVASFVSNDLNQHHLIKSFEEYTHYPDIKLYLLKTLQTIFAETTEITGVFVENSFSVLCTMKFPTNFDEADTFFFSESDKPFKVKEKLFRKLFSNVWNCFLNFELSEALLKKFLSVILDTILPNLQNPCLMTDFLTNAYNRGGVLSLLALKGLFHLMQNYNLEYPDFFVKLYSLVDKNIINGKFNSKMFVLLNLFLSSTHLPSHIVAAFVKKLSRLSLVSCTSSNLKLLHLISHLLSNHVALIALIHRTDVNNYSTDPFNFEALDPSDSNAGQSSLWEIKTLHSHINPNVNCKAREISAKFPEQITDVSDILNISMCTLYGKQRKRRLGDISLAIDIPLKKGKKCSLL